MNNELGIDPGWLLLILLGCYALGGQLYFIWKAQKNGEKGPFDIHK